MVESVAARGGASLAVTTGDPMWDVVVIGGGPAGAATARLLVSWGHRVALAARRPSRVHLSESLPPSCLHTLERVGLRGVVDAGAFVRSSGNTVCWGREVPRRERFAADAYGYQVDRGVFDELLLTVAHREGVHVLRDTMANSVAALPGDEWKVSLARSGSTGVELQCRWILDCTGRAGLLARHDGRREAQRGIRTLALAQLWERDVDSDWGLEDQGDTLVESYDGGWGWSVPASATRRCVAVMIDPARSGMAGRNGLSLLYESELKRAPQLARLVKDARPVGAPFARDATPYFASRAAEERSLLVGDAASFVDPLSSFGVKKALSSAWLAAVVVHTCLTSDGMQTAALALFEERERAMYTSLRLRATALAREAQGAHQQLTWGDEENSEPAAAERVAELDIEVLRHDPAVLAAFEEIRHRPALRLRMSDAVPRVRQPTVRDNRVVLEEQLAAPGFERGVRYVRNVDLITLAALASEHEQVPDLYDAYGRAAGPSTSPPLPDFLGALSMLVAKGVLDFV